MPVAVGLGVAVLVTPVMLWIGRVMGLVDHVDGDALKIHSRPVSVLGGFAVVAATFGSLLAVNAIPTWWLGAALGLALVGGLIDDIRRLPPWVRVLVQVAVGVILAAGGLRLEPLGVLGAAGVVLLVLACANAVNLVDGQDGLAGGLALISALGLAALAELSGHSTGTALGLALGGSLGGFLIWNRPPARIFLGNGGAYAVGTLLAVLATMVASEDDVRGILAAGACLGVFAFEVAFTVARRLWSRTPLARGDRLHSYDLVAGRAGRRTKATFVFWAIGASAGAFALLVRAMPLPMGALALAGVAGLALVWGAHLWTTSVEGLRRVP